ncbi:MAG: hypothetical protein ACPKPY_03270 [Nitrososphaeraceae archaeon]
MTLDYEDEFLERLDTESLKVANAFARSPIYETMKKDIEDLKIRVKELEDTKR